MLMMALPQHPNRMTEMEYLEFERGSEIKHEFIDGEVFAMTGASRAHNLISVNLIGILSAQSRGGDCEVYPSDMRVRIATSLYVYPDISVVCGNGAFTDDAVESLLNPTLVIEILSPSTEAYDRGAKFRHYRQIASLREYVLVAQDMPRIERYLLQDDRVWNFVDAEGLTASLDLPSIECALSLADVYERVPLNEKGADDDNH